MMKKLLRAAFALAAGGATADVVDFADPMVGTAGTGHCSPAAAFPFGMVQPGADTGRAGWNYCAGYFYPDTTLVGFSQTHLNGTGSTDLGDLSIFPFTGERPAKFESRFSHECETASPGFYAVTLDDFDVRAEATCSKRIAYYRFTAGGPIRLFVDPTSVINGGENDLQTRVVKSELKVESDCSIDCSSPISASTSSKTEISLPSSHGSISPHIAIRVKSPSVLSETVLPPVFGPVMTSVE